MITLVTGTPRSGKTLWCIEELFKYLLAKEQRPIFCDIAGFNANTVQLSPDDWRTVPDNSVIFYDECQFKKEFSSRFKGDSDMILELTTHGHRGIDIYFITQGTRYMNSDIFPLVGQHVHVHNAFNSKTASLLYKFRTVQTNLSKSNMRDAEDKLTWRYPEHLYDTYKSASVHNKKRQWPKKLISVITTFATVIFLGIYYCFQLFSDDNQFTNSEDVNTQTQQVHAIQQPSVPAPAPVQQQPAPVEPDIVIPESKRVAMVVDSGKSCHAYSGTGEYIVIDLEHCQTLAANPLLLTPAPKQVRDTALQSYNYQQQPAANVTVTTLPAT